MLENVKLGDKIKIHTFNTSYDPTTETFTKTSAPFEETGVVVKIGAKSVTAEFPVEGHKPCRVAFYTKTGQMVGTREETGAARVVEIL